MKYIDSEHTANMFSMNSVCECFFAMLIKPLIWPWLYLLQTYLLDGRHRGRQIHQSTDNTDRSPISPFNHFTSFYICCTSFLFSSFPVPHCISSLCLLPTGCLPPHTNARTHTDAHTMGVMTQALWHSGS